MQSHTQIGDEMLLQIVCRRWAKLQHQRWPSGAVQTAELKARGVTIEERTVAGWRQGQLPSNRHSIQLMRSGFGSLLEGAFGPAMAIGRLTELEAKIENEKAAIRAAEQELHQLRQALGGATDIGARGALRGEGNPIPSEG